LRASKNDEDLTVSCQHGIDTFPNEVWQRAFEIVDDCENFYKADSSSSDYSDHTDSNAATLHAGTHDDKENSNNNE
jgi:hypothetical protein